MPCDVCNTGQKVIAETREHQQLVASIMCKLAAELMQRGVEHDASKLREPELSWFLRYTPKLKDTTYGSDEYKQYLEELGPALKAHYHNNRHHPEHYQDGIRGMTLIDLLEMLVDWIAATARHEDGDILRSLKINEKRFDIPPELAHILRETVAQIMALKG